MTLEELQAENARLKARVSDLECDAETSYRQSMDDEYEIEWLNKITHGLMKEKEQLQAQVERLTKAGDAMAKLMFIDKDYIGSAKQESVVEWCKATDAREGKPRA